LNGDQTIMHFWNFRIVRKLDEIIHALRKARNEMINIENLSEADLDVLTQNFDRIRAECELRKSRVKS